MQGILFLILISFLKTEPLNPSDLTERFNAQRKENMLLEEELRKEEKKEIEIQREKIKQQEEKHQKKIIKQAKEEQEKENKHGVEKKEVKQEEKKSLQQGENKQEAEDKQEERKQKINEIEKQSEQKTREKKIDAQEKEESKNIEKDKKTNTQQEKREGKEQKRGRKQEMRDKNAELGEKREANPQEGSRNAKKEETSAQKNEQEQEKIEKEEKNKKNTQEISKKQKDKSKQREAHQGFKQESKQEQTNQAPQSPKAQEIPQSIEQSPKPIDSQKQAQPKKPTQSQEAPKEPISQNQTQQAPCFIIDEISLQTSLKKEEFDFLNPILEKYNHTCIQQDHLTALLKELQLEAVKQGYITTFFALAPQDLKSRKLIIALESSVVGKINHDALIAFWGKDFGIKKGDILNIQPLERGIYYYKRLRTLSPKFFLQALPSSKEEAQTQINVVFETKKIGDTNIPLYALLTFDNGGNQGSGIYQNSLQFGLENLLSLNEAFNSYSVLTPQWQNRRHSFYTSLDFSIPFRRLLFSTSGSYSSYAYPLFLGKKEFKYHGYSANLDLKGKILLYLDQLSQVSMTFGLAKRWAKNFLETIELITQRRNLTQIYASIDYSKTFSSSASLNLSLGIRQGVKILGSMSNFPSKDQKPPDFFFTLPTLDASLYLPFFLGEHRLLYFGAIKTQISRTQLYASEKMGLGGNYSVRGFDSTALNGDFGVLYRNDLTYYPPSLKGWILAPSLGIDLGFVSDVFNPASEELGNKGFLSGGGVGLKISFKEYFQAQAWGYLPFYNPKKQRERNFYFSLSCGF